MIVVMLVSFVSLTFLLAKYAVNHKKISSIIYENFNDENK